LCTSPVSLNTCYDSTDFNFYSNKGIYFLPVITVMI
jgi:hypothetical protein